MSKQFKAFIALLMFITMANVQAMDSGSNNNNNSDNNRKRKLDEIQETGPEQDSFNKKTKTEINNNNSNNNNNNIIVFSVEEYTEQAKQAYNSPSACTLADGITLEFDPQQGVRVLTKNFNNPSYQDQDSISFEVFKSGEMIIVLDCNHIFSMRDPDNNVITQKLDKCPLCRTKITKASRYHKLGNEFKLIKFLVEEVPQEYHAAVYKECKNENPPHSWMHTIENFLRFNTAEYKNVAFKLLKIEKNPKCLRMRIDKKEITYLPRFIELDFLEGVDFLLPHYSKNELLELSDKSPLAAALASTNHVYLEMLLSQAQPNKSETINLINQILNSRTSVTNKKALTTLIARLGEELDENEITILCSLFFNYMDNKPSSTFSDEDQETLNELITKVGRDALYKYLDDNRFTISLNNTADTLVRLSNNNDRDALLSNLKTKRYFRPYLSYTINLSEDNPKALTSLLITVIQLDYPGAIAIILSKCNNSSELAFAADNYTNRSAFQLAMDLPTTTCLQQLLENIDNNKQQLFQIVLTMMDTQCDAHTQACVDAVLKKIGALNHPDLDIQDPQDIKIKLNTFKQFLKSIETNKKNGIQAGFLELLLKYRMPVGNGSDLASNSLISFLMKAYHLAQSCSDIENLALCVELLIDYGAKPDQTGAVPYIDVHGNNSSIKFSAFDLSGQEVTFFQNPIQRYRYDEEKRLLKLLQCESTPEARRAIRETLKYHRKQNQKYFDDVQNNNNNNNNN